MRFPCINISQSQEKAILTARTSPTESAYFNPLAYAVKLIPKKGVTPNSYFDYTVYPLEGIWNLTDKAKADGIFDKNELVDKIMLRQPDFVTPEVAEMALNHVIAKRDSNPLLEEVVFEEIEDGISVQMLHIGSFDTESSSFEKMNDFCRANNLERHDLRHREIYIYLILEKRRRRN